MAPNAVITGWGMYAPERVVTNHDMAQMVETSDEWISTRTGIRERRYAADGETTATMSVLAARDALAVAGVEPDELDLVIVGTCSPDYYMPATAVLVAHQLGARHASGFDLMAACSGFVYSLAAGSAFIRSGMYRNVLVVGSELLSRFLDFNDRNTCVLFGDGAGAAVLVPGEEPGVIGSVLENQGQHARLLEIPAGGSREPASPDTVARREHTIHMQNGSEVFKRAVVGMAEACARLLEKSGYTADDVSLLVPHQANGRIIASVAQRLSFPMERVFVDLEMVGNTSAASVPIALDHAWREGRLEPGDLVLTVAFGAGLAYGANLIRWTAERPS
jgi:3-oxoacyl-[acyl-carrier-protein] synthase III